MNPKKITPELIDELLVGVDINDVAEVLCLMLIDASVQIEEKPLASQFEANQRLVIQIIVAKLNRRAKARRKR